jgi:hypothetical protein
MIFAIAALFGDAIRHQQPSFGQRYGANPKSTGNGGKRGQVARSRRAAAKRQHQQARACKQRPAKLARKNAAKRAKNYWWGR